MVDVAKVVVGAASVVGGAAVVVVAAVVLVVAAVVLVLVVAGVVEVVLVGVSGVARVVEVVLVGVSGVARVVEVDVVGISGSSHRVLASLSSSFTSDSHQQEGSSVVASAGVAAVKRPSVRAATARVTSALYAATEQVYSNPPAARVFPGGSGGGHRQGPVFCNGEWYADEDGRAVTAQSSHPPGALGVERLGVIGSNPNVRLRKPLSRGGSGVSAR